MNEDSIKSKTRRLLQKAHQVATALWQTLPAEERVRAGQPDRWAAKDLLAHLVGWNMRMNRRMAGLPASDSPAASEELDRINAALFAASRARTWEDLLSEDERSFEELLGRLQALSEDDLTQPGRLAWAGTRPAWIALLGNAHWHPYHHVCMYLVQHGELERATQMQEDLTQDLIALQGGDHHKGISLYNLACFYALTGRPQKAVEKLKQALPLVPDLIEWSKEDSDLDSLRDLEDFKSLYA